MRVICEQTEVQKQRSDGEARAYLALVSKPAHLEDFGGNILLQFSRLLGVHVRGTDLEGRQVTVDLDPADFEVLFDVSREGKGLTFAMDEQIDNFCSLTIGSRERLQW